jgi:hypothetical protein
LGGRERASGLSENPIQFFTLKGDPINSNGGIRPIISQLFAPCAKFSRP